FIRSGQAASLKIDAFPFQRFGVVPATVTYVSADAQRSETGGWHYRVRLSVDTGPLPFADELRSGMTLRADLIVGERRLVTYLLGPILRLTGESFREI
ncbi:MAG: HlyD family secretion protein, partial [Rhodobacteraceae bacterium]|nr:HlyD family secretion protein [Paracoccaceae bacterium]